MLFSALFINVKTYTCSIFSDRLYVISRRGKRDVWQYVRVNKMGNSPTAHGGSVRDGATLLPGYSVSTWFEYALFRTDASYISLRLTAF